MELKYNDKADGLGWCGSSNRTFMELKSSVTLTLSFLAMSSNRTFMELK